MAKAKSQESLISLDELISLIPKPVTASVELPSRGLYYDDGLAPNGRVEIKPMSAREEKLVAGIKGNNVDDIIDIILSRCLINKISPDNLLVTDRFYLLFALRANSYGEDYTFDLSCPHCEATAKYTVKIPGDLEMVYPETSDPEPFSVTLPDSKIEVQFRLLRGKDTKAIKNYVDKEIKRGNYTEGDPGYIYRIAKHLVGVNGRTLDALTAMELVSRISAKDCSFLKNRIDSKNPGLKTDIIKACLVCGKEIVTDLPMTAEFFRPDIGRETRTNANANGPDPIR